MTQQRAPSTQNYLLGKGTIYFAPFSDGGDNMGEIELGNAIAFALEATTEVYEHFSSQEGVREKDFEAVTQIGARASFTLEEPNLENLNLAFLGSGKSILPQSSGSKSAEPHTARLDRWVDLGYRNVTNVQVTGSGGSPAYADGVDYELDAAAGRIRALSEGGITEGSAIEVTFQYTAWETSQIAGLTKPKVLGFLRFEGNPEYGPKYVLYAWRANLRPEGEVPFITEEAANFGFTAELLKDVTGHPAEPFFRLFERP